MNGQIKIMLAPRSRKNNNASSHQLLVIYVII
jgi:hypothetical protein